MRNLTLSHNALRSRQSTPEQKCLLQPLRLFKINVSFFSDKLEGCSTVLDLRQQNICLRSYNVGPSDDTIP